jgi:hypothetical protein
MEPAFRTRALEIHSRYVWDFDRVRRALDFIAKQRMTALILHRNDIVDRIVWPARFFGASGEERNIFERYRAIHRSLYKYTPTRRSGPYHRRDYLKRVIELARRQGTELWFQNKELFFHEIFLELRPELTKGGHLCPSEPFWNQFVEAKYTELFQELPGLTGIITAPGTGESRLSIAANRCTCAVCAGMTPKRWYTALLGAMHRPVTAAGRRLVVRDFVFDKRAQDALADSFAELPADIAVSLKNTPHDYYPSFPDNPRIGKVGARPQWVEFDCMGQYFGWGIAPAILTEQWRGRMARAREAGVEGLVFRTDWESLDGHSAFHTPNLVNVYAGAALGRDLSAPTQGVYRAWLEGEGMLAADAADAARDAAAAWAEKLLGDSWEIVRRALYTNDCVFNDSSTYPVGLDHAWWLAEEKNSLKDWEASKADALSPAEGNIRMLLAEKDAAVARVASLLPLLAAMPPALTPEAAAELCWRVDVWHRYVRGFAALGRALLLARALLAGPGGDWAGEARGLFAAAQSELLALADEFDAFAAATDHRYSVYVLLGAERLRTLHADLAARVAAA